MNYKITHPTKIVDCKINLPASKSISNRLLIIQALSKTAFTIHNLSKAEDSITLKEALKNKTQTIDVGAAGTTIRFLCAYYATTTKKDIILTGSERMKSRPIKALVTALNTLGANISYLEKEGFPPLKISKSSINENRVQIDGGISSQFISALLLVAPTLANGLTVKIEGTIVSKPYIEMTLKLMSDFGIEYKWANNCIHIQAQKYKVRDYSIEADWSAAAFWFEIAALANKCQITLNGLQKKSIQGDSVVADIFKALGVQTSFKNNSLKLTKSSLLNVPPINLLDTPDLYQPLKCSLVALGLTSNITGLDTLKDKETDRVKAVNNELLKLGSKNKIHTYEDHRMAMSFAPLCITYGALTINNIEVVSKSYPNYWEDLKQAGFTIEP